MTQDIIYQAAWSPDGKFIAAATSHGLKLYSAHAFEKPPLNISPFLASSSRVAFAPEGTMMAWTEMQGSGESGLWLQNLVDDKKNFISVPMWDLKDIAFSPDGKLIAGAIYNIGIQIWDSENGKMITAFTSAGGAQDVDFSPDGHLLASAGHGDLMAHVWNVTTGEEVGSIGKPNEYITSVAFKDSATLAMSYGGAVQFWGVNSRTENEYARVSRDGLTPELVFSPDGNFLAVPIYAERKMYILDSALRKVTELEVGPYTGDVTFSPDGKSLTVVSIQEGLKIFDTASWELQDSTPSLLGRVQKMVFRPDKPVLITTHEDSITVAWDLKSGVEISRISSPGEHVLSPDGKLLAAGADTGEVSVWDVDTGKLLKTYQRVSKWGVSTITFSQDNRVLILSYQDDAIVSVVFWEWETDQEPKVFPLDESLGYIGSLTPDGSKLAVRTWENEISANVGVWDTQTRALLWISKRSEGSMISSTALHPNGEILAVGDRWNGSISLYDANSGTLLETLNEPPGGFIDYAVAVNDIIFSNSGKYMVTIINGGAVVWDLEKHTFIDIDRSCSRPIESLVFSQDDSLLMIAGGTNLATNITGGGGGGGICIWETQTGKLLSSLGWENSGTSNFATFNQDRTILALDDNGTIWLWGIFK
jgi:WD40 repeat protein